MGLEAGRGSIHIQPCQYDDLISLEKVISLQIFVAPDTKIVLFGGGRAEAGRSLKF